MALQSQIENTELVRHYEDAYARLSPQQQVRLDLAVVHRWAERWNWHEGVVNHLTAIVPGYADRFYAIPYGVHWSEVRARDFITVSYDGKVLDGDGEIELTSLLIHASMHRDLPQAVVVLHTHQPNVTALTCLEDQSIEMCSQHALHFPGRVATLNEFGLAIENSIGAVICEALKDRDILLMANHGVTVCGQTVSQAFDDLYYLDRACETQLLALSSGRKLRVIPDEEARKILTAARYKMIEEGDYHFRALRRLVWREDPAIAEF